MNTWILSSVPNTIKTTIMTTQNLQSKMNMIATNSHPNHLYKIHTVSNRWKIAGKKTHHVPWEGYPQYWYSWFFRGSFILHPSHYIFEQVYWWGSNSIREFLFWSTSSPRRRLNILNSIITYLQLIVFLHLYLWQHLCPPKMHPIAAM